MSDCRKCVEFSWCLENEDCGLFKQKPLMTNADRIRAMTDEKLAALLCGHACMLCPIEGCKGRMEEGQKKCKQRWLDWLKMEGEQ